jgi:peptide/nickel transport system substrate-binding protein
MRKVLAAILTIVFGITLVACEGRAPDDEKTLLLLMSNNPTTLNSVSATDAYASQVLDYVYDGLVTIDSELRPIPSKAKSWKWEEKTIDGEKKYILTFYIRDDIYWHDGVKFTVHDMVYTYEKIMDPLSMAHNKIPNFEGVVDSVTALDDYTLQVVYNTPLAYAVSTWSIYPLPKHIYTNEDFHRSSYNRAPVGTGPYRFVRWDSARSIRLEKNTNYWREAPYFDRIVFRIIPDDNIALSAFKRGDFDVYPFSEPEKFVEEKEQPYYVENYDTYVYYSFGVSQIAWNCAEDSIFNNKYVRQAMTYALDREQIAKEVFYGYSEPISGPFFYNSWAYNHDIEPIPFDLEKARELLAKAGWTKTDEDGVLIKDGKRFEFELIYGQVPIWTTLAMNLRENLRKIGVNMEIRMLEWSALSERLKNGNFDGLIFGWSLATDPDPFDIFHSSQIKKGINYGSFSNAVADDLMVKARTIFDINERQRLYHQLHKIFHEEQPYTYLFASKAMVAVRNNIKGVEVGARGLFRWYPSVYNWYRETDKVEE